MKGEHEQGFGLDGGGFAGPWLVPEGDYLPFVERLFAGADRRCLASLFIVGTMPWRDRERVMDGLLLALSEASWRGVDARLIVGGSPSNAMTIEMAEAARKRARALRVPCRWLDNIPRLGSHAKVVVADDHVMVGSHNWSSGAFQGPKESVCVSSVSLARLLGDRFGQQWRSAEEARGSA